MAKKANAVIVDTYAVMADLTGQASLEAIRVLDSIRGNRGDNTLPRSLRAHLPLEKRTLTLQKRGRTT